MNRRGFLLGAASAIVVPQLDVARKAWWFLGPSFAGLSRVDSEIAAFESALEQEVLAVLRGKNTFDPEAVKRAVQRQLEAFSPALIARVTRVEDRGRGSGLVHWEGVLAPVPMRVVVQL